MSETSQPEFFALLIGLLLLNALFVAIEFAFVTVRRNDVQERENEGSKAAKKVLAALDNLNPLLATVQIGVTACVLSIGYIAEPAIVDLIETPVADLGIAGDGVRVVAFLIALIVVTWFTVLFGELLPRTVSIQSSTSVALGTIGFIRLMSRVFAPFTWSVNLGLDMLLRLFKIERAPGMHMIHSEEELKLLVSQSSKGGVLEDSEQEMLYNVFDFADTNVHTVMVPRPDVVGFSVETPADELLAEIIDQPYTRYPIYRGTMDEIVGILHIRDLFTATKNGNPADVEVEKLLRSAHVVPESKSLAALLTDFRRSKSHLALVIDEYGSLSGIVTLEDLIEEIVGEIDDEHDLPERQIEQIGENHIRVDGKYPIEDLNETFKLELPHEDYHTVGGVVFGQLGQAPHAGDVVRVAGVRMEVVEIDGPRIVNVDIILPEPVEQIDDENSDSNSIEELSESIPGVEHQRDPLSGGPHSH